MHGNLDIDFEWTARDTPQQNHLAELGFAYIANKGCTMMARANIPPHVHYKVFREAFKTATLLDRLNPVTIDGVTKTRYEHWCGRNPAFAQHLCTWGEAGTVKVCTKTTPKILDRGVQCMFVGYALEHAGDCYRMWNPETNRVHESRDVIWLKQFYYAKPIPEQELAVELITFDYEDDLPSIENDEAGEGEEQELQEEEEVQEPEEDENELIEEDESAEEKEADDEKQKSCELQCLKTREPTEIFEGHTRSQTAAKRIQQIEENEQEFGTTMTDYQIELTEAEEKYYNAMQIIGPEDAKYACIGAGIGGGFLSTEELHVMKYDEAIASKDKEKWFDAVNDEHE